MRRRDVGRAFAALGGLAAARAWAEQPARLPRVAILSPKPPAYAGIPGTPLNGVLRGLKEFGYVAGQTVELDFRFADNALERLPELAAELVAQRPDVLFTWSSAGARAAAAATSTIPIVVAPANEAVVAGLVPDFAHPGGNVTGWTLNNRLLHEKCLQLLKEVVPGMRHVAVLVNPLNPAWRDYPGALRGVATELGLELIRVEARGLTEIDQAFEVMKENAVDGLFAIDELTLAGQMPTPPRILELIASLRLPSVSDKWDFAQDGGLISIGADVGEIARGGALYIHRILQGTKLAELPVVHPTKFILAVNLRTAKWLDIEIPSAVLLRADQVIE